MISKFFIERPVLANVLAILMVVIGAVAVFRLPIEQYPDVVPPTVQVSTRYPDAGARTVIESVALPIEQQVNGVEGMIYMQSYAAADGTCNLTVTFRIGVDLNLAQILVQNRVSAALAQLPDAVQDIHSEEHLVLVTPEADKYQPGDVLLAIPVHVCPTSALYDRAVVVDNGRIVDSWEVTSRNRRITW